ncbi:MAG: transcriptional repressor [Actinobacteria bacterium]|nr:MAG: transcriptional repressor [Actinomycetota bacterium]
MTDQALSELLRDRGQRVTSQRLVINRFLHEHDGHLTAEQVLAGVADALPGTALPTVYATLELFEDLGVVRRVQTGGGTMVFDPRTDPHHHLTCRRCGAVEDVEAPVELAGVLRRARRTGFEAEHAEVVVSGLCRECAANA